ncbi:hypothetical protein [Roseiflexus sp.]|uniref:hypothetical protein n=1 Tax=Roseiflexus sp. TaxID=2562120 RepID=UPI00398B15EC
MVNIADAAHPVETSFYDRPDRAVDIAYAEGKVYVADDIGELFILQPAHTIFLPLVARP